MKKKYIPADIELLIIGSRDVIAVSIEVPSEPEGGGAGGEGGGNTPGGNIPSGGIGGGNYGGDSWMGL